MKGRAPISSQLRIAGGWLNLGPESGSKQTLQIDHAISEYDPQRKSNDKICCDAQARCLYLARMNY